MVACVCFFLFFQFTFLKNTGLLYQVTFLPLEGESGWLSELKEVNNM